ncbi:lipid-A-disaccharide synthase [bacterium]|nr:lipid-A-disaccharide synthase [bacterium]
MGRSNILREHVKIAILAGEVSGDVQGAYLAGGLLNNDYGIKVSLCGVGGEYMKSRGVKLWEEASRYGSVGFWEPIKFLPGWLKIYGRVKERIKGEDLDAVIFIDNQGFNLQIAKFIKKERPNLPMFYYFSPQAWLWGSGIAKQVRDLGIKVLAVFPKERDVYKANGVEVYFVGHPLLDIVEAKVPPEKIRETLGIQDDLPLVGLFPGSRQQEITSLLPIMLEGVSPLINREAYFYVASASQFAYELIVKILEKNNLYLPIISANRYDYMNASKLLIMASGTAVLESALVGVPVIALYKLSWISWNIAKRIVHYPYATMPNILLEKPVVIELLQKDANPIKLRNTLRELLSDDQKLEAIKDDFRKINEILGEKGAIKRAVECIFRGLNCIE